MFISITSWLEQHYLACPFKELTGVDCIGCGVQRAFVFLLKGELVNSFRMYPALIPMLVMFIFLAIHLYFKFPKGGIVLKYNFILVVVLMVGNYAIKLLS
jgi:hypothetical protein